MVIFVLYLAGVGVQHFVVSQQNTDYGFGGVFLNGVGGVGLDGQAIGVNEFCEFFALTNGDERILLAPDEIDGALEFLVARLDFFDVGRSGLGDLAIKSRLSNFTAPGAGI
jgi:hypothetical protein